MVMIRGIAKCAGTAVLAGCAVAPLLACTAQSYPSQPSSSANISSAGPPRPIGPEIDQLKPFNSPGIALKPEVEAVELSAAEAEEGVSVPWKFLGFAGGSDVVNVAFFAGDGDCVNHLGFFVYRDGDDVVVEAVSMVEKGRTVCMTRLVLGRSVLHLPAPIGGSVRLVHAAIDPPGLRLTISADGDSRYGFSPNTPIGAQRWSRIRLRFNAKAVSNQIDNLTRPRHCHGPLLWT